MTPCVFSLTDGRTDAQMEFDTKCVAILEFVLSKQDTTTVWLFSLLANVLC